MSMFCRLVGSLLGGLAVVLSLIVPAHAEKAPLKIAMMIPGEIDDGGFMEAGYRGLMAVQQELDIDARYSTNVIPRMAEMKAALKQLAADKPDMVIAHGGQASKAVNSVAKSFPDIRFVVIQGSVIGANLSCYEIKQEQSAWLAGAAAGLLTESNVVGHISGIRVKPGLKARGAFYNGLMHTNPDAKFLTTFAGDQDDVALAHKVATAEIDAGADIIFTMLNAGREGATDAIREKGAKQIGNVSDWVSVDPSIFIGSAVADVSKAVRSAVRDLANGRWKPGDVVKIGLEDPEAVKLTLGEEVSDDIRNQMEQLRLAIVGGKINVSVDYKGREFRTPK